MIYEQRYTHLFDMIYNYDLKGSLRFIRLSLFLLRNANITICNKHFVPFLKSSRHVQCSEKWMSRVISLTIIHISFYNVFFLFWRGGQLYFCIVVINMALINFLPSEWHYQIINEARLKSREFTTKTFFCWTVNVSANSDQVQGPNTCFDYSVQSANNSAVHMGLVEDKVWLRHFFVDFSHLRPPVSFHHPSIQCIH
jgi:hypothetical protein